MPDVIDFEAALKMIGSASCSVLLGNGFSADYCSYKTLLEKSGLGADEPCRRLFDTLDTPNFERVVRALEDAAEVEGTYGNADEAARLTGDAEKVRKALVTAVQAAHPTHLQDIADSIPSCIEFLNPFGTIFTTNYDLLLYWVIIRSKGKFGDGFVTAKEANGFRGPFEDVRCNVYNIHGGLHLFVRRDGELEKRLAGDDGGLQAIADTITNDDRFPLYVAEGSTESKEARIGAVPYLKLCFKRLKESSGAFFIYGSSVNENDAHIYNAIFGSKVNHVYFCIYDQGELAQFDAKLAYYQKANRSKAQYTFVDAESAGVWASFERR